MDVRQLRYFLTVAEEGQITSAAKKLHMEQPPLSRQMRLIEEELGVALFDRSGKRLRLTPAGERLRDRAAGLLRQLEETVAEVRELDEGVSGVLSVGAVVSCTSLLPGPLGRFRERYPNVSFKLSEGDHHLLGERLDRREIEIAVARLPFEAPGGAARYEIRPLPSDPIVALLPAGAGKAAGGAVQAQAGGSVHDGPAHSGPVHDGQAHDEPLHDGPVHSGSVHDGPAHSGPVYDEPAVSAGTEPLSLAELSAYPLVSLKTDRTVVMHETIMRAFADAELRPRVLCECASVAIALTLVAHGFGAALLPKSVMSTFPLAGIECRAIRDADLLSEVGLVWLKDRYLSRAARRFVALFDASDGQSGGGGLS
ncbi:LysR family transcriptional regulator [Cohnella ginsengisoli]|uniref:LysR family transcriptional regulator n=1 Tax=Cohnella ginsengisoli TaxID=425004 RepID=A0A9X4KQE8_9BACL|nr:LysR family transcriptional regulator [Cohnella ginsengisoli]MDG0794297.1 LysR family transcriptional regulator [Cohnella ginsengisoli]